MTFIDFVIKTSVCPWLGPKAGSLRPWDTKFVQWNAMTTRSLLCALLLFALSPAWAQVGIGRGLVSYGWPAGKSAQELELADFGYWRFDWAELQPDGPDGFNWSRLDDFISAWHGLNRRVAFGVMVANSHTKSPKRSATPLWVYSEGVRPIVRRSVSPDAMLGTPGVSWTEPESFTDRRLLELVDAFIRALAARYDGDPRIEFIDIRSFNNWGEGYNAEHVALHLRHFSSTRLIQPIQSPSDALAAASRGIGIRRDGIGGSDCTECLPAAGTVPIVFEFWGDLSYLESRGWWARGEVLKRALRIGRPSYVEILRSSPGLFPEYYSLYREIKAVIGYSVYVKNFSVERTAAGSRLRFTLANSGLDRPHVNLVLRILKNDDGNSFNSVLYDVPISAAELQPGGTVDLVVDMKENPDSSLRGLQIIAVDGLATAVHYSLSQNALYDILKRS